MKFTNQQQRMEWLKAAGAKINELEVERNRAIMDKDFARATTLLKARLFAQREFGKVSRDYARHTK